MPKNHAHRQMFQLLVCLLIVFMGLTSCSSGAVIERDQSKAAGNISRADPGYLQYLEKQSMLGSSAGLAAIISGSGLAWRVPGSGPNAEGMLRLAGAWVSIHPQTVLAPGHTSPLGQLSGPIIWNALDKGGIRGMYIAPTGGSGALWDSERRKQHGDNEDVVAYQFARYMGKDDDYKMAAKSAAAFRGLLGGDLIPAATGIGPDFFLASRDFRNYTGVYCMVEVPKNLWSLLPASEHESQVLPLSDEQTATLESKGLIPAKMQQDSLAYLPDSGWAVTGEVRGVDGNLRRWVYRYFNGYKRPVLNWADPSATARQVLNGSVIRQVGLFGNAINGFRVRPFIGLERSVAGYSASRPNPERGIVEENSLGNYTLAMEASTNLARQARSYGGWSWQRDELPLPLVREFMEIGPDFVQDSVFSPAAEHALLTGNAAFLRFMADEAIAQRIEFRRLVHSSTGHEGVSYLLPHLRYLASLKADPSAFVDGDTRAAQAKILLAEQLLGQINDILHQAQAGKTIHPLYRPRVEVEPEEAVPSVPAGRPMPKVIPEERESELKVTVDPASHGAQAGAAGQGAGASSGAGAVPGQSGQTEQLGQPDLADLIQAAGMSGMSGDAGATSAAAEDADTAGAAPATENEVTPQAQDQSDASAQDADQNPAQDSGADRSEAEMDAIAPQAGPDSSDDSAAPAGAGEAPVAPDASDSSVASVESDAVAGVEPHSAPDAETADADGSLDASDTAELDAVIAAPVAAADSETDLSSPAATDDADAAAAPESTPADDDAGVADASAAPAGAVEPVEPVEPVDSTATTASTPATTPDAAEADPELAASPDSAALSADAAPIPGVPPLDAQSDRLFLTPAGIAATALGLDVHSMRAHEYTQQDKDEIQRGHSLLVFFKAMQPGLLMLSGHDMVGLMPLTWHSLYNSPEQWSPHLATLGTFPVLGSSQSVQVNSMGLPRGNSLYGALDLQSFIPDSFLNKTGEMLRLRESLGIAEGELSGRLKGSGSGLIALVTKLPDGSGYAVNVSNFSRNDSTESLLTKHIPGLGEAIRKGKVTVAYGELAKRDFNPERLNFTIRGWEGALILVETKSRAK